MGRWILAALAFMASTTLAQTQTNLSDDEISAALIGSWVVPPESPDRVPGADRTLETFQNDGTYVAAVFQDAACTAVMERVTVKWSVENGVLTSVYPNGEQAHDRVLSIGGGRVTLQSLDDGTTYIRAKASNCGQQPL